MSIGLIGRKVGMTQVFQEDGTMVAVSVLAIEPNTVTRLRTADRDGYTAVQLGANGGRKVTKPVAGQLKDLPTGVASIGTLREFRVDSADGYELGVGRLTVDLRDTELALGDDDGSFWFAANKTVMFRKAKRIVTVTFAREKNQTEVDTVQVARLIESRLK